MGVSPIETAPERRNPSAPARTGFWRASAVCPSGGAGSGPQSAARNDSRPPRTTLLPSSKRRLSPADAALATHRTMPVAASATVIWFARASALKAISFPPGSNAMLPSLQALASAQAVGKEAIRASRATSQSSRSYRSFARRNARRAPSGDSSKGVG